MAYYTEIVDPLQEQKDAKLHDWNIIPKKTVICEVIRKVNNPRPKRVEPGPITWTVSDISKAGCLLANPPLSANFDDEQEMRRVYTLIYDVFRYKNVMNEALDDVNFFQVFPLLGKTVAHVWLLLYDLYHRRFRKRDNATMQTATKLLSESGLLFVENALYTQRVKLAASVARLRIKHNALVLSDLLPGHLKDERVTGNACNNPVTCWVNIKKVSDVEGLCRRIEKSFGLKKVSDIQKLEAQNFKWDKHCPQIIIFHSSMRASLARSVLIRNHELVVQDRSFCLGPATFGKIIEDLQLAGSVIQTHINSPRSTAYLATILSRNDRIKKLLAFSAGKRKSEYENYFEELGMNNVLIFAERLVDLSPDSHYMEEIVAVFATPPNSYSAVTDPIDLVCSRGGDLSILKVLTDSEDSKEGKDRVASILDEQRRTLRFAMSRPQIQVVLYETHSELNVENEDMVKKTVNEINKIAKIHHAALQGKINIQPQHMEVIVTANKEINNNNNNNEKVSSLSGCESDGDTVAKSNDETIEFTSKTNLELIEETFTKFNPTDKILENIKVPDTDIFDIPTLPNLCPGEQSCTNPAREGCYLALLKRKEVIKLDNKYMIRMAESRGLFGTYGNSSARPKGGKASKKKPDQGSVSSKKSKRKLKDLEMQRISMPTHSFLRHARAPPAVNLQCRRCRLEGTAEKSNQCKRWWCEATRHILSLRDSLERQKILPPVGRNANARGSVKGAVDAMVRNATKVDEVVAKSHSNAHAPPVFPKLRLSRAHKKINDNKKIMQIPITKKAMVPEEIKENLNLEFAEDSWGKRHKSTCVEDDINGANPKKMLGNMTSFAIRQLVSSSYKQRKPLRNCCDCDETNNESDRSSSRFNAPNAFIEGPLKKFRKKILSKTKLKQVVERISVPTQAFLGRSQKKVAECDHEKKTAFQCCTREFHCESCRKKNMGLISLSSL